MNSHTFLKIFRNRDGRIAIVQKPNLPILGWAISRILAFFSSGELQSSLSYLATAFLFTWAYLEIRSGVNTFRRLLGLTVLCFVLSNIFGQIW